jgi:hypothetical protein
MRSQLHLHTHHQANLPVHVPVGSPAASKAARLRMHGAGRIAQCSESAIVGFEAELLSL